MAVLQSIGCATAPPQRPAQSSLKSRGSITSPRTRSLCVTSDLYIDDMRACVSVKKASGAVSSLARRYAFVGHLRNARNTAAVIELFASIIPWIMPEVRCPRYAINRHRQCAGSAAKQHGPPNKANPKCRIWVIRDRVEPAARPAWSAMPRKRSGSEFTHLACQWEVVLRLMWQPRRDP